MSNVLIVGGGPVYRPQLKSELDRQPDLIIAADNGASYLRELGFFPHVSVGDYDSLPDTVLEQMKAAHIEIHSFSPQKDYTDLELALDLAIKRGAVKIRIMGGLGRRLDHTLGNVGLLLKPLKLGIETHLFDEFHDVTLINKTIQLTRRPGWAISLIPLTHSVTGVTTIGLQYPLSKAELFLDSCRGIHNQFTAETANIEISEGILIVIFFREDY